jgi:23S rRNA pseudouridine1911/1915/1917 synthase
MKTQILYEDSRVLIIYKPAGLATQTARVGQQDVVSELKNYLKQPYLGLIHRLDQPVEGLLVFAKEKKTAAQLTSQLVSGTLNKQYYAVVCGKPDEIEAELVDYLGKDSVTGNAFVVKKDSIQNKKDSSESAKKAILRYRVMETTRISTGEKISLLDVHIATGRFHQIRVQLANAGFPLLGDARYGTEDSARLSRQLGVNNVALCAYQIALQNVAGGKALTRMIVPEGRIFRELFRYNYPEQ